MTIEELFDDASRRRTLEFYATRQRWRDLLDYRQLQGGVGQVDNIFFGDSITEVWPLHEFFPTYSILNRGLAGDNVHGLLYRINDDVLAYKPKHVFMLIGINGIDDEQRLIEKRIQHLAGIMLDRGIEVFISSILPLRHPDNWDRFRFQDKIVAINTSLREWSRSHQCQFLDYHRELRDSEGQLAAGFACDDGTHLRFPAYVRMAEIVRPFLYK